MCVHQILCGGELTFGCFGVVWVCHENVNVATVGVAPAVGAADHAGDVGVLLGGM